MLPINLILTDDPIFKVCKLQTKQQAYIYVLQSLTMLIFRSAALDHADPYDKGENLNNRRLLGGSTSDRPFSFDDHKNFTFVESSLIKTDDGDYQKAYFQTVFDWLNDL